MSPAPTLYAKSSLRRESTSRLLPPLVGGHLALDFLNTATTHVEPGLDDALSPGYVNLIDWSVHAGVFGEDEGDRLARLAGKDPRGAAAVRRRTLNVRSALYPIVRTIIAAEDLSSCDLTILNAERRSMEEGRYLVAGGTLIGVTWQQPLSLERPLREVVLATSDLLLNAPHSRLRQCEGVDCERVFLDTSRGNQRRYCSANGCGTVARVRRFRERQKQVE